MIDRVPLEFPLYGARFGEAASRFRRKLFVFSGRASRSEFWWAYLLNAIILTAVMLVITVVWTILLFVASSGLVASGTTDSRSILLPATGAIFALTFGLYGVILLIILVFQVSLLGIMSRRLHDSGFSALWLLLLLVPSYGMYAVLVMCALDTKPVGIRYDRSPGGPILYPPTLVHGSAYPAPMDPLAQQVPPAPPFARPGAPTAEPATGAPPAAPPTV